MNNNLSLPKPSLFKDFFIKLSQVILITFPGSVLLINNTNMCSKSYSVIFLALFVHLFPSEIHVHFAFLVSIRTMLHIATSITIPPEPSISPLNPPFKSHCYFLVFDFSFSKHCPGCFSFPGQYQPFPICFKKH